MSWLNVVEAVILGVIEGLTEFLPVSSTAHLLLAGALLGFESPTRSFEVLIQLGAILALLIAYAGRLWRIFANLGADPGARRFVLGVLLGFLPAAIVGATLYKHVKAVLEVLWVPCVTLIVGGCILLIVDRLRLTVQHTDAQKLPLWKYLVIGLCQCIAMIPGVSR
ncbi:MAG: undecaprenyl-diphosphate phosphatase, partial [Alphaproteobacteria bacterium]